MDGFTQTLHHKQDVTQGQFLSRIKLVQIQSFPPPTLVAMPKTQSALLFTHSWIHAFLKGINKKRNTISLSKTVFSIIYI